MRGLKIGSSRWGAGFFTAGKSGRGLDPREKAVEPAQAFVNALDRSCVGKPQISRRAECVARYERNARFVEQQLREFGRVFRQSLPAASVRKMRRHVWERIKRSARPFAGDTVNRAQPFHDSLAALFIF